jgi:hypothetical protein
MIVAGDAYCLFQPKLALAQLVKQATHDAD